MDQVPQPLEGTGWKHMQWSPSSPPSPTVGKTIARLCSLQYPCPTGRVSRKSNCQMTRYEFRRSANFRHSTTRRLKHRLARERVRLHNWVRLGHYDTAKFLLTRFDLIIAPVLKVSHLLKGHDGCGHWHADLLLSYKLFTCQRCGLCVDRQIAGVRNNLLAAYGRALGVGWDGRRG